MLIRRDEAIQPVKFQHLRMEKITRLAGSSEHRERGSRCVEAEPEGMMDIIRPAGAGDDAGKIRVSLLAMLEDKILDHSRVGKVIERTASGGANGTLEESTLREKGILPTGLKDRIEDGKEFL